MELELIEYREEDRRAIVKIDDKIAEAVVVNSTYKELRKFKNVLVTLPTHGSINQSAHEALCYFVESKELMQIAPHWRRGDELIAFKFFAPHGESYKNKTLVPLGKTVLATVKVMQKNHPTTGVSYIVDVYIDKDQTVKPEWCFEAGAKTPKTWNAELVKGRYLNFIKAGGRFPFKASVPKLQKEWI